jgi:hypothetical protein
MTPDTLRINNDTMNEARQEILAHARTILGEELGMSPADYLQTTEEERKEIEEQIGSVWERIAETFDCDAKEAASTAAFIIVQAQKNPMMAGLTILLTGVILGRRQGRAEAVEMLQEGIPHDDEEGEG